eukprot:3747129-Pleurochrysis_carterae.AAC.1
MPSNKGGTGLPILQCPESVSERASTSPTIEDLGVNVVFLQLIIESLRAIRQLDTALTENRGTGHHTIRWVVH